MRSLSLPINQIKKRYRKAVEAEHSLFFDIPMLDADTQALLCKMLAQQLGKHHRTMPPACAAHRDNQLALPLISIERNQIIHQ